MNRFTLLEKKRKEKEKKFKKSFRFKMAAKTFLFLGFFDIAQ